MKSISCKLSDNIKEIETLFENTADLSSRRFKTAGTDAAIYYFSTIVSKQDIALTVLNPIMNSPIIATEGVGTMKFLEERALAAAESIKVYDIESLSEKIMLGFCALLVDGAPYGLCFGVQAYEKRSVQEPDNETMQRGAKDGFAENFQTNMSLIRRRLHSPELKFEQLSVGDISATPIVLCYLKDRAKPDDVRIIRDKLKAIKLDNIAESAYIAGSLKQSKIFDAIGTTERPDTLCSKLCEGKIAIIIDGTPDVIVYPYLFIENFRCIDDYAARPYYSSFIIWIRYLAFIVAAFLPGVYAAVVIHRPELLPDILLTKFAQEQSKTPFTVIWELLLVNFLYEVMREAGLRAPKALSQAVSIVGTLVIGDTAVSAGMIGAPSLMVIASSAVSAYAIPKLYDQLSILRLGLLIIGGSFGTWGVIISAFLLICNIVSQSSLGVPSAAPIAPFDFKAMGDILSRRPIRKIASFRRKNED